MKKLLFLVAFLVFSHSISFAASYQEDRFNSADTPYSYSADGTSAYPSSFNTPDSAATAGKGSSDVDQQNVQWQELYGARSWEREGQQGGLDQSPRQQPQSVREQDSAPLQDDAYRDSDDQRSRGDRGYRDDAAGNLSGEVNYRNDLNDGTYRTYRTDRGDAGSRADGKGDGKDNAKDDQKGVKRKAQRDAYEKRGEQGEPSPIEKALSEEPVTADKSRPQPSRVGRLTQFGYNFFRADANGFAPQTDVPVGPEYLIGAGDRLVVTIWGSIDGTFNLEVNRSGEIALPKVGALRVAGQRFDQLQQLLTATVGRVYKNFHLNVTMGKLRFMKVYVVGEVKSPGDYNVSSLSTLINALSAAGGPTKNGSLRNIKINRNGKTVETVDLYDFFLRGDKTKDIRLHSGDTVFVPVIGPVAAVAGNVRRPGIYELKGERTLKDLLSLADGINPTGYLQRVQLYRVQAHDKKVVSDLNLDLKDGKGLEQSASGVAIQDMDLVKVFPIDSVLRGYVRLTGHVLRPGDYALKPGMRVSALLGGDNLLPEYYTQAGQIIRLFAPDLHPEVIYFNVAKALAGDAASDLELKEFDRVKIFTRKEMEETPTVKVSGEVQRPGAYRYFDNMTVRDLVMQGGNVKQKAYLKDAEVLRLKRSGDSVTTYTLQINLGKALEGGAENIKLEPFDELTVRRIPNWAEMTERYVRLKGEFVFPGIYPIHKGERLSSVIERAGGFSDLAYLKGARFTREAVRQLQQQRMDEALNKAQQDIVNLQTKLAQTASSPEDAANGKNTLEGLTRAVDLLKTKKAEGRVLMEIASLKELKGSVYDVELQGGDMLTVPSDPGGVNVIGDVYNQNAIVSQPNKNVDWYLSQVGGATGEADMGGVYVVKVDGSVISQQNSTGFLFYNSFWGKKLDSGDTIIVPHQYEKTAWLKDIKDIAGIIGNIAVTAGVLVAAGLKF